MAFKIINCATCPNKHPDHFKCTGCEYNFSLAVSIQGWLDTHIRKEHYPINYCPICGLAVQEDMELLDGK